MYYASLLANSWEGWANMTLRRITEPSKSHGRATMDIAVRQRIFDSFHDAESKRVLPKDEAEAKEYSQNVYAVWKGISVSLSRTALLIFLFMVLFELLAYQHDLTAISIGSFTLVNVPIIQIALPAVVAYLTYDGPRLTARFLRLELVYMELVRIYAPRMQSNGLELLLEPNLPSLWGVGALSFEHTGNFSDSLMRKVNQTVLYVLSYAVPIAFECQAFYRLIQKFGLHNIFLWINLVITMLFIIFTAVYVWFDRVERAIWWKELRPNQ